MISNAAKTTATILERLDAIELRLAAHARAMLEIARDVEALQAQPLQHDHQKIHEILQRIITAAKNQHHHAEQSFQELKHDLLSVDDRIDQHDHLPRCPFIRV